MGRLRRVVCSFSTQVNRTNGRACLEGIACEAAAHDGEETYTLLNDWVSLDPAPDRDGALAELARRYLAAHEPATPDDFYAWSGLYKRDASDGWDAIGT